MMEKRLKATREITEMKCKDLSKKSKPRRSLSVLSKALLKILNKDSVMIQVFVNRRKNSGRCSQMPTTSKSWHSLEQEKLKRLRYQVKTHVRRSFLEES
jgi:hypothetical protein